MEGNKGINSSRDFYRSILQELLPVYTENEAKSICYLISEDVMGISRTDIAADKPLVMRPEDSKKVEDVIRRLKVGEPIQYILGKSWFRGHQYLVNPSVLIPRQETEELVQLILNQSNHEVKRMLDIGSGSGCIAISTAIERPDWEIDACDVSKVSIELAKRNALQNGVSINFFSLDILNEDLENYYDIIVSNPPYIPEADRKFMERNVLEHEPSLALFVPDDDPLKFYRRIIQVAQERLKNAGSLYFEIEENSGKELMELLRANSFVEINLVQDLHGKDRMISSKIS